MPKEPIGFREQLENIRAHFPTKECLSIKDVSAYTGIGIRTVPKHFNFKGSAAGQFITRTQLAMALTRH